jgi:endonuclease I
LHCKFYAIYLKKHINDNRIRKILHPELNTYIVTPTKSPQPMKIKATYLLVFLFAPFYIVSQVPGYYQDVNFSVSQEEIRQQLTNLVTATHFYELTYTPEVWNVLKIADLEFIDGEEVVLLNGFNDNDGIYKTDRTRHKDLNCTQSSCKGLWNREHVFPRSLATPPMDTSYPSAGTDAHGLRAVDSQMNSSRSNRAFESGSGDSYITSNGNFYPGDEWKGDVARILTYLYLRYPTQCEAVTVGIGPSSYSFLADMPNVFLEWNAEDPVSAFEMERNEVIYENQGNRNPFIDNPYLATRIWNGPEAENLWNALEVPEAISTSLILYPTIRDGYVYMENKSQSMVTYSVYTISGNFILEGQSSSEIDLGELSKGMYFINLQSQNYNKTEKIIMR